MIKLCLVDHLCSYCEAYRRAIGSPPSIELGVRVAVCANQRYAFGRHYTVPARRYEPEVESGDTSECFSIMGLALQILKQEG